MLFLFISCCFNGFFFTIPVKIENERLKLALTTPTGPIGPPITVENYAIEILPVVTDKAINDLSN